MKEPVDHILRPRLPWRCTDEGAVTECGYDATKVRTLSREEFFQRLKDFGRQRTAMMTCMTCSDTASRWGAWSDDPRHALSREIEWERWRFYRHSAERGQRLLDELLAIEELIGAHRDEFDAAVKMRAERRVWNAKKAVLANRPPPSKRAI